MDAEWSLASVLLGGVSLLGGYLCRRLSHRYQVPQFKDFVSLENHLKNNAPAQRDDVLVEGRVGTDPAGDTLTSKTTGLPGVVELVAKTRSIPVRDENFERVGRSALTNEERNEFEPFKLWDTHGRFVLVESVCSATGFRKLLQLDYEFTTASEKGPGVASSEEVPDRALTRYYLLHLGTPLAAYGEAVLSQADGPVSFTPTVVGSSIKDLHYPNMKASVLKLVSVILFVAGGTIIVFGVIPLIKRFFPQEHVHEQMLQQQQLLSTLDGTTIEQSVKTQMHAQGGDLEPGIEAKQQPHRR